MIGRRRPDMEWGNGELPTDLQPGDYWQYVDDEGNPKIAKGSFSAARAVGNLTGGIWGIMDPNGGHGTLILHTVREHDDGTISVLPDDGSSNSILNTGHDGQWHGYIYGGEWRPC